MKNNRDYTIPYSATDGDMGNLDSLLDGLDLNGEQSNDDNASQGDGSEDTSQQDNNPTQQQNQNENTSQQQTNANQQHQQSKANYTFMQMRQQNQQLLGTLKGIAKAKGIEYTNTQDLIQKLNNTSIEEQAKEQNVPVALLQEINLMRQQTAQLQAQSNQNRLVGSFTTLMNNYGLSKEDLTNFADELLNEGVNPMDSNVDIVREYKSRHQDEIINALVDKKVEEALKRVGQADTNSSTPSQTLGNNPNNDSNNKITTMAQLNTLLDGLNIEKK